MPPYCYPIVHRSSSKKYYLNEKKEEHIPLKTLNNKTISESIRKSQLIEYIRSLFRQHHNLLSIPLITLSDEFYVPENEMFVSYLSKKLMIEKELNGKEKKETMVRKKKLNKRDEFLFKKKIPSHDQRRSD